MHTTAYEFGALRDYRFVVIFARYNGKWLYSRKRGRDTWETAGGHIENGESSLEAAKRELWEETGALDFEICPAFDYNVKTPDEESNGQVFFAQISRIGTMPDFEMEETELCETYPDKMTYPDILPVLYKHICGHTNVISIG